MVEIAAQLRRYVAQSYGAQGSPVAAGLTNISAGWESDVYAFCLTVGPEVDRRQQELILRIYPGEDADRKAQDEYRALALLHQMDYPVPEVYRLETDHAWFGRPFIIMEKIEGGTLWPMIFDGPEEEQQKYLSLYCGLMLQLHRLDWRPYVPEEAQKVGDPLQYARKELDRARWHLDKFDIAEFAPFLEWLEVRLPGVPCERASVAHMDFHPENILIQPDGTPQVIDWTSADITDARFDLAWSLMLIESYKGAEWRSRVRAEYERQAGSPLVGMDFFDVYACLRRLFSVVVSLKAGAGALGMRPGAEQLMKAQREPMKIVAACLQRITGLVAFDIDRLLNS